MHVEARESVRRCARGHTKGRVEGAAQGGMRADPPGRNMGPGSQTGSDIIQRPPVNRMTDTCMLLKILPCPKLHLRAVLIDHKSNISSDIRPGYKSLFHCKRNKEQK